MNNTRLDFDRIIKKLLSRVQGKALATFMYKLINQLGPTLCRSCIRYCYERLDRINAALPDGNVNKELFKKRMENHQTFITKKEFENIDTPGIDNKSFKVTIPEGYPKMDMTLLDKEN